MANFCTKCGYQVKEEWDYCPVCGCKLPKLEESKPEMLLNNVNDIVDNSKCLVAEKDKVKIENKSNNLPKLPRKIDYRILEGRLKEFRVSIKRDKNIPAYCVFSDTALCSVVESRNNILIKEDLLSLNGWGNVKVSQYGDEIIDILNQLDQNYIPNK